MGRHSQGCRNCVRRHLKCDETKPFCARCTKAGLKCGGSRNPTDLVFLDETRSTQRRLTASRSTSASQSDEAIPSVTKAVSLDSTFLITPTYEFDLSASSQDVYLSFLLDRFVGTNSHYADHISNGVWMCEFLSQPDTYPLSCLALKALAPSFYGRRHHQRSIVAQSITAYGTAIRELSLALADNSKWVEYDTMSAIIALYYYEYMTFTTKRGWLQHAKALSTMIELKGPEGFHSFVSRCILDTSRELVIGATLAMREKTFLEDDAWQLHGYYPLKIGQQLVLLENLYARVPGIAEAIQKLEVDTAGSQQRGEPLADVQRRVVQAQQDLKDWISVFTDELDHHVHEVSAMDIICDPRARPYFFSTLFNFENLIIAKAFLDFWTISIMTLEWAHKLTDMHWERGIDHRGMEKTPDPRELALNICRSVAYFLQPFHMESAPWYLSLPIRTAFQALPRRSPQAQWLSKVIAAMADENGIELTRNILTNIPTRKIQVVNSKTVLQSSPSSDLGPSDSASPSSQSVAVQA